MDRRQWQNVYYSKDFKKSAMSAMQTQQHNCLQVCKGYTMTWSIQVMVYNILPTRYILCNL